MDHPSGTELEALSRGKLSPARARAVWRHLLAGCDSCLAAVPPPLSVVLGTGQPAASTPEIDAAYDTAFTRAFAVARRHGRHLLQQRAKARKALAALEEGGLEAVEEVARKTRGLALYEALLARSWALRHEEPAAMIQYARLATTVADSLSVRRYGRRRVADFQSRAWAELGNALRVADKLDQAESAFTRAVELFHLGTNDGFLGTRLLELQASLAADCRRFPLACRALTLVYRFYRRQGDSHLAGRALISKGLYTGYAGDQEEAMRLLRQGFALIDPERDPVLSFAALHNQIWFLVDGGQIREARKLLFLNRRYCEAAGGRINQMKQLWLQGRIEAGQGELGRAEMTLREVTRGFVDVGRFYHAAISSLDLAAVLLSQRRAAEAQDLVVEAAGVFAALKIDREAMGAVLLLRQSIEMRAASAGFVQEVSAFLRRAENDPNARFDPQ